MFNDMLEQKLQSIQLVELIQRLPVHKFREIVTHIIHIQIVTLMDINLVDNNIEQIEFFGILYLTQVLTVSLSDTGVGIIHQECSNLIISHFIHHLFFLYQQQIASYASQNHICRQAFCLWFLEWFILSQCMQHICRHSDMVIAVNAYIPLVTQCQYIIHVAKKL